MVKIFKANILNWFKTRLNSVTNNIKMNGTQNAGSSELVARADHVHPTDTSRAASTHTHGNVSNDGKVGTAANKPLITGTNGVVQAGSFGTAANTFCQGNDSRLSDSRIPTSHTHMLDDINITSALGANSDLNDLTNVGIYTCGSTNSGTLANRPPYFGNYSLLIENKKFESDKIVQYVTALATESPLTWCRFKGSSGWSQWTHMGGCSATVPANTDLNDLTDLTIYSCNTNNSATLSNKPFNENRACIIQNKAYNNHKYFIQFVYTVMADNSLNEIYYRIHSNGTWLNWKKIINDTDISILEDSIDTKLTNKANKSHTHFLDDINVTSALTANDDLNNYKEVGIYTCTKTNSGTLANKPYNNNYSCIIENKKYSSGSIVQFVYKVTTNADTCYDSYFRCYTGNTWTDWVRIYTNKDIEKINGANLNINTSSNISIEDAISGKADSSHTHGNVSNDGKVGTAANKPLITGTNGVVQAGSFGTAANTFCQGNDSRLSNARTPTTHAVNANTYGLGTTSLYGHVKTVNDLTQASHSDGLALSAYQGKVLNDSKANKTDVAILSFRVSNSITAGILNAPDSMSISKGGYVYIGCADANGNALEGNIIVSFNNGASIYNRTLSSGMASLQISNAGTFNIQVFYHKNGQFKASMMGKVTAA